MAKRTQDAQVLWRNESDSNMVIVHVNINGSKLLSTVRISAPNFAFTLGQIRHHSQRPGHTQNARPPRSYVWEVPLSSADAG